jgi:hypothetical protein
VIYRKEQTIGPPIVLVGESKEMKNYKSGDYLSKHMAIHLSINKMEHMKCNCKFHNRHTNSNIEVKVGIHIIPQDTV